VGTTGVRIVSGTSLALSLARVWHRLWHESDTRVSFGLVVATVVARKRNDFRAEASCCRDGGYGRFMSRRHRQFSPGAPVHLTAHGLDDQPIFLTDFDRFALLALLRRVTDRAEWDVLAWCFMDTHYHLLVTPGREPRISWAMQTLNSVYAREFNGRHRRRGHLFGERFKDTLVASELHLVAAHEYVLENPVRAGIVQTVQQWRWSGDGTLEPRPAKEATELTTFRHRAVRRGR